MIIAIVVLELIACVSITILIALANRYGDVVLAPLQAWLACAILQLVIHYWPRGPYARYGLLASVMLLLLASATLEDVLLIPISIRRCSLPGSRRSPNFGGSGRPKPRKAASWGSG